MRYQSMLIVKCLVLARGPKYFVVRGCQEEDMRVEVEKTVLKHKWDCMGRKGEKEEEEHLTEEEIKENESVTRLAEEMGAQTKMVIDDKEQVWDARGMRVTA